MFTRSRSIGILSFSLLLLSAPVWARASSLEGVVKDPNGRPVSGADVRIESKRDSNWIKVVKTDGKGHYFSLGMPAGTYRVTLSINGSAKSSINNTRVITGDVPTELNFDLKTAGAKTAGSKKTGRHMVWVPARTGSHMGGAWVEVDDNGNEASMERVDTAGGNALRQMQGRQFNNPTSTNGMGR